jgi:predicted transcriptional regulator
LPSSRSGIIGIYAFKETLVSRFVEGVVTLANVVSQMVNNKAVPTDKVEKVMLRHFQKVNLDTTLGRLARIFEKESYAVVVTTEKHLECKLYITICYLLTFMVLLSHSCAIFVMCCVD